MSKAEIGEEEIARAIVGPHRPVHASSQWALDELREVRWNQLTNQEQAEALSQARAVLALLHPALERARGAERERCLAIVNAQTPDWVKERSGPYWDGYREAMEDAADDIRKGSGE